MINLHGFIAKVHVHSLATATIVTVRSGGARFTITVLSATVARRVDDVITDAARSRAQVHDALTVVTAVVCVTRVLCKWLRARY